jgi:release factor glutamine methyltransferase
VNPYSLYKRALMTYWYWHVRKLNVLWPSIMVGGKKIAVYPSVYKPLENEHSCVEYIKQGDRVLDLGCGTGISTIFAAGKASEVVAVDICPMAVENTRENCRLHNATNVSIRESDMFANVDGKFDVILANPPYIAVDFKEPEQQFGTSVRYLPVLFTEVHKYLADGGLLLVQYPGWFTGHIKRLASEHGLKVTKVERLPRKNLYLQMLSFAYMQIGFRSTLFHIEPARAEMAPKPENSEKAGKAASDQQRQAA